MILGRAARAEAVMVGMTIARWYAMMIRRTVIETAG